MKFQSSGCLLSLILSCAWIGAGCQPGASDNARIRYQEGKAALQYDPERAREHFEAAVREDTGFADAYLELAYLHEEPSMKDPVAAVFYFQKFLELDPDSPLRQETVRPRIDNNLHDLADDSTLRLVVQEMENDMSALEHENEKLKNDVVVLERELEKLRNYINGLVSTPPPSGGRNVAEDNSGRTTPPDTGLNVEEANPAFFLYEIKPQDNYYKIGKAHGVDPKVLEQWNLDKPATALKPGDMIKVPNIPRL